MAQYNAAAIMARVPSTTQVVAQGRSVLVSSVVIRSGSGNVGNTTLRSGGASGTVVLEFDVPAVANDSRAATFNPPFLVADGLHVSVSGVGTGVYVCYTPVP